MMQRILHAHDGVVGEGVKFERIRRITGYLVGGLERFNNGKKAEEHDRIKHMHLSTPASKKKQESPNNLQIITNKLPINPNTAA